MNVPQVNCHNLIPLLLGHCSEGPISQDTSVGHNDVKTTELLECDLDESIAILNGTNRCSGFSARYDIT